MRKPLLKLLDISVNAQIARRSESTCRRVWIRFRESLSALSQKNQIVNDSGHSLLRVFLTGKDFSGANDLTAGFRRASWRWPWH